MTTRPDIPSLEALAESLAGTFPGSPVDVDYIFTLPDREIFEAVLWSIEPCKLVVEGAAAAPVAALLHGLIKVPPRSKVAAVLSGGNLNLDQLRSLAWN